MRRLVRFNQMAEITRDIKELVESLKEQKSEIIKNINFISDYYQSNSGEVIKQKYLQKVNDLNLYIETLDRYINWFEKLSGVYKEVSIQASKKLSNTAVLDEIPITDIKLNINGLGDMH